MRPKVSRTFHGRDIFAPAAAHLARGVPLKEFGREVEPASLVRLPLPEPVFKPGRVEAHVLRADHFGNLVCDLKEADWIEWLRLQPPASVRVRLNRSAFGPIRETFADVGESRPVAYFGSSGRLELALRNDNLARRSRTRRGARVFLNLEKQKSKQK